MFLNYLLAQNLITELQYNRVLAELDSNFDGNLTKALESVGLSEDSQTQAKGVFYKLPYQKIGAKNVGFDTLKYISEDAARHYHFVPSANAIGTKW